MDARMRRLLSLVCLVRLIGLLTASQLSGAPSFEPVCRPEEEEWRRSAIQALWKERREMGHTPLFQIPLPGFPNVDIFFKNETASASGTLKHRFAWALVLWAVLEGKIRPTSKVFDSTSGNTGASEAYMCRLIKIPFYAVVAKELEVDKAQHIQEMGGQLIHVDLDLRSREAERLGNAPNAFFINQFGNADRAEESHESGNFSLESTNVLHEILAQLNEKKIGPPDYFVHSAGTGGTISSVGRYVQRYGLPTRVVLADSEFSLFYDYVKNGRFTTEEENGHALWTAPGVAGIGYGYEVDPVIFGNSTSLVPSVIHEVAKIPDAATIAGVRVLRRMKASTGAFIDAGPSSALNFLVSLAYARKQSGNPRRHTRIVSILCDPGSYYTTTYLNNAWVEKAIPGGVRKMKCWEAAIDKAIASGGDFLSLGRGC